MIRNHQSTGYNFADQENFPFLGEVPTIFYSNYIQRTFHFSELLAKMEEKGLIIEEDITFGARATKVKGKWGDPEPVESKLIGPEGEEIVTTEFVEGIIIFTPKSEDLEQVISKIIKIAEFIETRAVKREDFPFQIRGSWEVPDNRIKPVSLSVLLEKLDFRSAVSNFLGFDRGNLIALKQKSTFDEEGWKNSPVLVNQKLYSYLADGDVLP